LTIWTCHNCQSQCSMSYLFCCQVKDIIFSENFTNMPIDFVVLTVFSIYLNVSYFFIFKKAKSWSNPSLWRVCLIRRHVVEGNPALQIWGLGCTISPQRSFIFKSINVDNLNKGYDQPHEVVSEGLLSESNAFKSCGGPTKRPFYFT
jgi:hypothetical protein